LGHPSFGVLLLLALATAALAGPVYKSSFIAGYIPQGPGHFVNSFTDTTTMVVPKIKSCPKAHQSVLVGVDVDLENDGFSGFDDVGVIIECSKGKAHYLTNVGSKPAVLHPNDKVVISEVVRPSKITSTIIDKTHNSKRTGTLTGSIEAGPGGTGVMEPSGGVPNFGTIHFSASSPRLSGTSYDMYRGETLLLKATGLTTNKTSFKAVFEHH
jgi:hypothetical protein